MALFLKNIKNLLQIIINYKKSLVVFFALMTVILIYKYFDTSPIPIPEEDKIVVVEVVKKSDIKEIVNFIGTIRSRQQTGLRAKTNGILTIIAKPGQLVTKGDLIAKIQNQDIENNYKI